MNQEMQIVHTASPAQESKAPTKVATLLRRSQAGMTLLEVLIVLALISVVAGTVGVMVFNNYKRGLVKTARIQVAEVTQATQQYMMDNNHDCPSSMDDLIAEKYVKKNLKDPWGKQFLFTCPGEQDPDGADVVSAGPDKQEGTDDDIRSWEL